MPSFPLISGFQSIDCMDDFNVSCLFTIAMSSAFSIDVSAYYSFLWEFTTHMQNEAHPSIGDTVLYASTQIRNPT